MKRKKLYLIMVTTILMVFSITGSVAYYRYVYSGSVKVNTSNVVFNVSSTSLDANTQKINLGSGLKPGSSGSINVTFDSTGSDTDMYVTFDIKRTDLPNSLNFYYSDSHSGIVSRYYSLLDSSKKSETLTLYWYWDPDKDDENDNEYINKTISAQFNVSAVQISEYATMRGRRTNNANSFYDFFWSDTYRKYIRTIYFGNDLSNLPSSCTASNLCWDISESSTQNKKVYGYLIDSGLKDSSDNTKTLYNLYIVSEAPIFAPINCDDMFYSFSSLRNIDFNNNFNTSKVTDMGGMFNNCSSLISLDLSSFNTSNVTDMKNMFYKGSSLTSLDVSSFNTSNVADMGGMFSNCSSLTSLNVSGLNTSNVTHMGGMFGGCSSLTSLDVSNFNTSNVIYMNSMFGGCSSLASLDLNYFDTSNVISTDWMFNECSSLISLDLSSFNTSNVTDMSGMFYKCSSLKTFINIMSVGIGTYRLIFHEAATVSGSKITVNYIADASELVDSMIATKSSNSNVVKGNAIIEPTITISGNTDITYESNNRQEGTTVTLKSISGNYLVTSFKMNGTLVEGNTFTMPNGNVTITDISTIECLIVETEHYPYNPGETNLSDVVLAEKTFVGATSLTVTLDYEIVPTEYDIIKIYDSSSASSPTKVYTGSESGIEQETITINSNYIKITLSSSSYFELFTYYGLKATIIPNY